MTISVMMPVKTESTTEPTAEECAAAAEMQALVDGMFERLRSANIPHCLLRNRDRIPWGLLEWTDIDIVVSGEVSQERLIDLFADLSPAMIAPRWDGCFAVYFVVADHALRVDVMNGDIEWRAAVYIDHQAILARRQDTHGIMTASLVDQALLVWFEKLVRNHTFKPRYEALIREAYLAHPTQFRQQLEDIVGKKLADQLIYLIRENRLPECTDLASACRRSIWLRALRRAPFSTVARLGRQIGFALEHRMNPSGVSVSVIGPDLKRNRDMCSTLETLPSRRVPFSRAVFSAGENAALFSLDSQPTAASGSGYPLRHSAQVLFGLVGTWRRELIQNRQRMAHMSLVLHEHHPSQLLIDHSLYRHAASLRLARLVARLTPTPDMVLLLDVPEEIIMEAMHGTSLEEASRRRRAYQYLATSLPHARLIDAMQPSDAVIKEITRSISEFTAARTRRRLALDREHARAHT
jgi:hypothetical protein